MYRHRGIRKRYGFLLALGFLLLGTAVKGQGIKYEVLVPLSVEAGRPFNVEFRLINAKPESFAAPDFSGLEVVAGPIGSQGEVQNIINGHSESYEWYSNTYTCIARQRGKATIPAATVPAGGKSYSTKAAVVEVRAAGAKGNGSEAVPRQEAAGATLDKNDILLRVTASSTDVYKGEPIRVAYKIYTRVDFQVEDVKYPAFNGFWTQELDVSGYDWQRENYNGSVYQSRVIREYLVFPQQAGTLSIEQASLSIAAQLLVQSPRNRSLFGDFFGGGPQIEEVRRTLTAGPLRITVRDLPAGAPAGFEGAVGKFTFDGGASASEVAANSSANYEMRIAGSGNLPLVNAPKVEFPSSFEQYTVKSTDNYRVAGNNITGSKTFTVPFIARAEGSYTIPPVRFVYFDPQAARYVTLQIPEQSLTVGGDASGGASSGGGIVSGVNKEDLKILGDDIRFIRTGHPGLHRTGWMFLWSWQYVASLVLIVLLFVAALIYLQKRIRLRSNTTLVRNKRARKAALRRLKAAERNLQAQNDRKFYEEMLRGMWGYMSDKLNIPVAKLSRDNVRAGLLEKGVEPELADRYIGIISDCECAQYAPTASIRPRELYEAAVELISKFESRL